MAALYGSVRGSRGEAHRLGSAESGIRAQVQTWHTVARVSLNADGSGVFTLEGDRGEPIAVLHWTHEDYGASDRIGMQYENGARVERIVRVTP